MSPEPSTVQIVALLIGTLLSVLLFAGIAYLIWKTVRTGRLSLRGREAIDGHAARAAYTQGMRDAGWQTRQHLEFQQAQARLDQFVATLNQVGVRLDDIQRRLNQATPTSSSSADTTVPVSTARPTTGGTSICGIPGAHSPHPVWPQPGQTGRS